jgi:DNA-directed RNA polymerase subunit K/omega
MENKNIKLIDAIDKNENIYEVIINIAQRTHELIKGAIPSIEIKKNENLIDVAIEEYLIKRGVK